jgi:hypothetical protein
MVGFFIALGIIALATALAVQLTEALGLTNEEPVAARARTRRRAHSKDRSSSV